MKMADGYILRGYDIDKIDCKVPSVFVSQSSRNLRLKQTQDRIMENAKKEQKSANELQPKQLIPYLPYELQAEILWSPLPHQDTSKLIALTSTLNINVLNHALEGDWMYLPNSQHVGQASKKYVIVDCKPILKPFSDVIKEIEYNGEKLPPIASYYPFQLRDLAHDYHSRMQKRIKEIRLDIEKGLIPIWVFNEMLKLHIDVFGLINEELAIDINTIKS